MAGRKFKFRDCPPFGSVAVIWSYCKGKPKITRIFLSDSKITAKKKAARFFPDAKPFSDKKISALINQINRFLKGKDTRFSLTALRLDLCSDFQKKVLRVTHAIPRGKVSSYGLIARRAGSPRAYRAAGTALAKNPFPIIIPCHRVLRSGGRPGGYQNGVKMKRALLAMEGVRNI